MAATRSKYSITISFSETSPIEVRLIKYLKIIKEKSGEEVKSQIIKAMMAFYDVYAIGENPDSTSEEIEDAMTNCFIELSGHMSRVAAYGKTRHGINSPPESWKQFGLILNNSIAPSYSPAVQHQQPTRSNDSAIPTVSSEATGQQADIDVQNSRNNARVDPQPPFESFPLAQGQKSGIDMDVSSPTQVQDDDDDDDDNLSAEEYIAKMKARGITDIAVISND
jgi:hypothetical protein